MATREVDLVLDSGAFTAWRQEREIDLKGYITFIQKHKQWLWHYVNLDVIPGRYKKTRTPSETEDAAAASFKNMTIMDKAGLRCLPVFHQGENLTWLEKMLDYGCDYIGLSPINRAHPDVKKQWLDKCFTLLCNNDKGMPCIRTHAFGLTAIPLLVRYPWYSADSVKWLLEGGFGSFLMPPKRQDGTWDYECSPIAVTISHCKDSADIRAGNHFDQQGHGLKDTVAEYLEMVSPGTTLDALRSTRAQRTRMNAIYLRDFSKQRKVRPFFPQHRGFFHHTGNRVKPIVIEPELKMIFTISTAAPDSLALQEEGCRYRLITYWNWLSNSGIDIEAYVKTGVLPGRQPKEQQ